MPNREFNELISVVRPPAPEVPRAEQLARQRQQVFHAHEPRSVQRGPANPEREFQPVATQTGPASVDRAEVCVLDERGGHVQLGMHCPHFKNFSRDEVIDVIF